MQEYEILGQKIVIANQKEAELASFAIKIVNDKIDELQKEKPLLGPHQIGVLALLQIAGSLVKDRRSMDDYRRELDDRCSALMLEVSDVIGSRENLHQKSV